MKQRIICFGNIQGKFVWKVATFLSSSFILSKRFYILESKINKFVLSVNIIGVSLLELQKKSFIFMRNKSEPRMEPWSSAIFVFTE